MSDGLFVAAVLAGLGIGGFIGTMFMMRDRSYTPYATMMLIAVLVVCVAFVVAGCMLAGVAVGLGGVW